MTEPHNIAAAETWSQGGADYEFISFGLNDGLGHAVQALWPRPGEHILDLATGTGRTARLVAEQGARVTGADIAEGLLAPARALSAHLDNVTLVQADAEDLPFDDATFDGVISTYGVMFAADQARAASELARVTRPGGRMVLLTWINEPEGYIPAFFGMIARYAETPPPEDSPMNWGDPDWIERSLGGWFDLDCTPVTTRLYAPDSDTLWDKYRKGFGSMAMALAGLDDAAAERFRADFHALHAPHRDARGLCIDRQALMVRGTRRAD